MLWIFHCFAEFCQILKWTKIKGSSKYVGPRPDIIDRRINFLQDINSKWNEVKTLVPQRDQTLQDEMRKQQNNEALRRQFADKSNQVGPWIEKQMDAVSAIGMGMQARVYFI